MNLCLWKSFAHFINGFFLFKKSTWNVSLSCHVSVLSSAFPDIHIAALALCVCQVYLQISSIFNLSLSPSFTVSHKNSITGFMLFYTIDSEIF